MKKGKKKGGPEKGLKGKKGDSCSSNHDKEDFSHISVSSVRNLAAMFLSVMRRGNASNLQEVQKHLWEWMIFHPSLNTSPWSHAFHLTPCLGSNGM
jgi:hypothetical protein